MNLCDIIERQRNWLFPLFRRILPLREVIRLLLILSPFTSCLLHAHSCKLYLVMRERLWLGEFLNLEVFLCGKGCEFCLGESLGVDHWRVVFKQFHIVVELGWFDFVKNDDFACVFVAEPFSFKSDTDVFRGDECVWDPSCDRLNTFLYDLLRVLWESSLLHFSKIKLKLIHQGNQAFIIVIRKRVSFFLSVEITDPILYLLGSSPRHSLGNQSVVSSICVVMLLKDLGFVLWPESRQMLVG